jgi:polyphosphate kinase
MENQPAKKDKIDYSAHELYFNRELSLLEFQNRVFAKPKTVLIRCSNV